MDDTITTGFVLTHRENLRLDNRSLTDLPIVMPPAQIRWTRRKFPRSSTNLTGISAHGSAHGASLVPSIKIEPPSTVVIAGNARNPPIIPASEV